MHVQSAQRRGRKLHRKNHESGGRPLDRDVSAGVQSEVFILSVEAYYLILYLIYRYTSRQPYPVAYGAAQTVRVRSTRRELLVALPTRGRCQLSPLMSHTL